MNSAQRRRAYRAMPKEGQRVAWTTRVGNAREGIVEGKKEWFHGQFNEERLNVPCVHRVRVKMPFGSHVHPLVKNIRIVRGAA
ncbi:hypothetical protein [Paraburkholderia unamae]|uniref:Uncharacterized protein n=1 Tax=Paraburkholderia unamae TaxID=219649 RepID=A0ABX5KW58_9BURK|nr:hypothetical protein [Paraburkholderia unamae]PVX86443.1 hypothetical protein C7402_102279 [Paraburkholderia unamae]